MVTRSNTTKKQENVENLEIAGGKSYKIKPNYFLCAALLNLLHETHPHPFLVPSNNALVIDI